MSDYRSTSSITYIAVVQYLPFDNGIVNIPLSVYICRPSRPLRGQNYLKYTQPAVHVDPYKISFYPFHNQALELFTILNIVDCSSLDDFKDKIRMYFNR